MIPAAGPLRPAPAGPVRTILVDDHPAFRTGLRAILADVPFPGAEVVAEASCGDDAVAKAERLRPDLVLMDLQMRGPDGTDGLSATRRITGGCPAAGVLVVSMFADAGTVQAAFAAGARGFVLKGASAGEIVGAVRAVASGCAFLGTGVSGLLAGIAEDARTGRRPFGIPGLTERESEVLALLNTGLGTGDIARTLHMSPKTVRNHMSNLFGKLGVANRAQAVVRAREAGLGPVPIP
ncbi:response regulator transcription factor [Yinghuangia soli]|uniref:Response regulator transcription factor n=1 Tax=Yinghuangia soli TaxID=2908204 RepID=A0AA41U5Q0_9ACTN|nr:response regulator transcription factor [Yinghuangia soli]MCF2530189.1 response regulator transcription factor [Yinghuangia soli]